MSNCGGCRFANCNNDTHLLCRDFRQKLGITVSRCDGGNEFDPVFRSGMKVIVRKDAKDNKNNCGMFGWEFVASMKEEKTLTLTHSSTKKDCVIWYVAETGYHYNEAWLKFYDDNSNKLFSDIRDEIKILKTGEKQMQKYEFKGEINLSQIVNDSFREGKRHFIVMSKENAVIGVLKNTNIVIPDLVGDIKFVDGKFVDNFCFKNRPYFLKIIESKDVHNWLTILKEENRKFNNKMKNQKSKNRKKVVKGTNKKDRFRVFTI